MAPAKWWTNFACTLQSRPCKARRRLDVPGWDRPGQDLVEEERDEEHPLASARWAIERIEIRGLPAGVESRPPTSSGSPSIQAAKPGEASRLLSFIARANRSLAGKNDSRSMTPTFSNGALHAESGRQVEVAPPARSCRGCWRAGYARGWSGFGVDPMSASRPRGREPTRSRYASAWPRSRRAAGRRTSGDRERSPAPLPGV